MSSDYSESPGLEPNGPNYNSPMMRAAFIPTMVQQGLPYLLPVVALVMKQLDIDVSKATTIFSFGLTILTGLNVVWPYLRPWFVDPITHSVIVSNEEDVVNDIREWVAEHVDGSAKNHVSVVLGRTELDEESADLKHEVTRYAAFQTLWFRFEGYLLYLEILDSSHERRRQSFWVSSWPPGTGPGDMLRISTYGLGGSDVLETFVQTVEKAKRIEDNTATVFSVNSKSTDVGKPYSVWISRSRPSRPMETINLDKKMKSELVGDFETFIGPGRAKWYLDKGIPYYRGYLFTGPAGTGKSSTAFALACLQDKSLYTLSLKEVCNEGQLRYLFSVPRKGDVLLLEDINTAGIRREHMEEVDLERIRHEYSRRYTEIRETQGVTLASLLNAIDTARKDGVILVMTTNHPEKLDDALIRAGRIDRTFHFGNITQEVAKRMFERLYKEHDKTTIEPLAEVFGSVVPDEQLTPADVQGYLISHDDPKEATEQAADWIQSELKKRQERAKEVSDRKIRSTKHDGSYKDMMKARQSGS